MQAKLSVLIPCKNEVENLPACIASLRGVGDEILIADSGSTDGTLEIAKACGATRIIEREFINSGDFKNWAIPQAAHEWVLVLDADERLTPDLAEEIRQVLAAPPLFDGYALKRRNHFMGHRLNHTSWARDKVTRLIRRDRCRYQLHTDHSEIDLPPHRVKTLTHPLIHYTCWDYDVYLQKMIRYTDQQAELWYQQGRRPSLWKTMANGPLRFFRSYILELGFLDGWAGLQVSVLTGFYSFLKQARLWHKCAGRNRAELDQQAQEAFSGT